MSYPAVFIRYNKYVSCGLRHPIVLFTDLHPTPRCSPSEGGVLEVQHNLMVIFSLVYSNPKPPIEDVSQSVDLSSPNAYAPVVHHAQCMPVPTYG